MINTWPLWIPVASSIALAWAMLGELGWLSAAALGICLAGAVLAAVHHAEVVAHRLGEPFGTLVLALAVTVIEASLILSIMMAGGPGIETLARDTLFAAVMIICNGVVGICVLLGGWRHHEQWFRVEGATAGYAALIAMATLSLVLPVFTTSTPSGTYSDSQLTFAAIASLVLWAVFVFVQTVRHRDYFLPARDRENEHVHAIPPTMTRTWSSFVLLCVCLVSVVGLAKLLSPIIEQAVIAAQAPRTVIGITIALIVLLPETCAAIRAARANRLQTSMNLAIGSALASIGLTIPVVVVASMLLEIPLVLGLEPKDLVLLALTFGVGSITLGTGRTHVMQGAVLMVIFVAFLFLALVP